MFRLMLNALEKASVIMFLVLLGFLLIEIRLSLPALIMILAAYLIYKGRV